MRTLALVDLERIKANARAVVEHCKKPLIAVVKDDAYGHGAPFVAHALHQIAMMFAVADTAEGIALRLAGEEKDILVLTPPASVEEAERLLLYDLTGTLSSRTALHLFAEAGKGCGRAPRVHLAVNTGMNRYGFRPERVLFAAREAREEGLLVEGAFSHLYQAENERARREQTRLFQIAFSHVKEVFPQSISHLAASGGLGKDQSDAVRAGLALYGYLPAGAPPIDVKPAMRVYSFVSHACTQTGGGAGYAPAKKDALRKRMFTLRAGYGDGLFRAGLPIAEGKLCMDASVCLGRAKFGERKLLIDDFAAYAKEHGTTAYEVLVRVGRSAERRYV